MKTFFVMSDIHSFYYQMIDALDEAGFDRDNPDHWLISCGDALDRGSYSEEVFHFLMSLERKILIKGNHDTLLEELCLRGFPYRHDISNGTVRTVNDIGGAGEGYPFDRCCENTWNRTAAYRASLVNYFETEKYIFVHSWLPTMKLEKPHPADKWIPLVQHKYLENWRTASDSDWEHAMWGNPFELAAQGINQTGKTIIFGHFHTSYAHSRAEGTSEFGKDAKFDPYHGDGFIAIDACTAYSGKCNVLVLEDEFLD